MTAATVKAVYARALLDSADARQVRALVVEDCRALCALVSGDDSLLTAAASPSLGRARARELVEKALTGRVQAETLNLCRLLCDRGRILQLPEILTETLALAEREAGVVKITVTSAFALPPALASEVEAPLRRIHGSGATITWAVDAQILGGLVIRVGEELLADDSVRRHIEIMRRMIRSAPWKGSWEGVGDASPAA